MERYHTAFYSTFAVFFLLNSWCHVFTFKLRALVEKLMNFDKYVLGDSSPQHIHDQGTLAIRFSVNLRTNLLTALLLAERGRDGEFHTFFHTHTYFVSNNNVHTSR